MDGGFDELLYQLLLLDLGLEHLEAPFLVQLGFPLLAGLLLHDGLRLFRALSQLLGAKSIVLTSHGFALTPLPETLGIVVGLVIAEHVLDCLGVLNRKLVHGKVEVDQSLVLS